jgi:hypothetical protein
MNPIPHPFVYYLIPDTNLTSNFITSSSMVVKNESSLRRHHEQQLQNWPFLFPIPSKAET